MNDTRRKQIAAAAGLIAEAVGLLESVRDEEQEAFDNLPDSLQYAPGGQQIDANVGALSGAIDALQSAIDDTAYL